MSTFGRSPCSSRIRSQTASLTRSAAKLRLFSGLRCEVLSTRKVWRGVIQSDQATPWASA